MQHAIAVHILDGYRDLIGDVLLVNMNSKSIRCIGRSLSEARRATGAYYYRSVILHEIHHTSTGLWKASTIFFIVNALRLFKLRASQTVLHAPFSTFCKMLSRLLVHFNFICQSSVNRCGSFSTLLCILLEVLAIQISLYAST